jgi:putative component of membrane protein insertase Oxa1/YidC/SpoIIIJ protein YidD
MSVLSAPWVIRACILGCVTKLTQFKLPRFMEPPATALTISSIRIYQHMLSPWLGQQCLFRPSCSERSIGYLDRLGWSRGIGEVNGQLRRCCGNFIVRLTPEGLLELEMADGRITPQQELSHFVLARYETAEYRVINDI